MSMVVKEKSLFLNNRGFTLVEVIIAGTILFTVLAVGSLAFRTSLRSLEGVAASANIGEALPAVLVVVKEGISNKKNKGSGRYSRKITYVFEAMELETNRNMVSANIFSSEPQLGEYLIRLYNVQLSIKYTDSGRSKKSDYEYQEFSWSKEGQSRKWF